MPDITPEFNDPLQSIFSEVLKNVDVTVADVVKHPGLQAEPMLTLTGLLQFRVGLAPDGQYMPIVIPMTVSDARELVLRLETTIAEAEAHWYQLPP